MAVDISYAQWLQDEAHWISAADPAAAAKWGELALESQVISPLIDSVAAAAEAARQQAFLGQPIAADRLTVIGTRRDLEGKVVTAKGAFLDYGAGADVLVIGADEDRSRGITVLTVLRRLT